MPRMPEEPSKPETVEKPALDPALSPQLPTAEDSTPELSLDEITDLGSRAATALSDPLWKEAFKLTLQEITASWLQSGEHETQLRENLYHRARNLFSLESLLEEQIRVAQQVNLTEAEKAEQDLNRYEDEQGFGLEDFIAPDEDLGPH